MLTSVYIDGFNLYYGAVKRTPFKWLDLRRMIERVFPNDDIREIHYFTALVQSFPVNPGAPERQQIYWRALRTIRGLHMQEGAFRTRTIRRPLVESPEEQPIFVAVRHPEEKKSDVNLATRLVADAAQNKFEQAVVLSNDSDFSTALQCVRDEFGKHVVLLSPNESDDPHVDLKNSANSVRRLRRSTLASSQFADRIRDQKGEFSKPGSW